MNSNIIRQIWAVSLILTMFVLISVTFSDSYVLSCSSSMPEKQENRTSLGAVSLPGRSITNDGRLEALLENQQYELNFIVNYLVVFFVCCSLWRRTYNKSENFRKVNYRLLI